MNLPIDNFDFQGMLNERQNRYAVQTTLPQKKNIGGYLRADKTATLFDFIKMVAEIVSKTMPEVEFYPDEGAILKDPSKKLEKPVILYQVVERQPAHELKARYTESIIEDIDEKTGHKRFGHNWTQRQNCIVQFNAVAESYQTAERIINKFEDMMITYSGYYKSQGVVEVLFHRYYTDIAWDNYRQYLSVRSIQFFVEIEKIITTFDATIGNVDIT